MAKKIVEGSSTMHSPKDDKGMYTKLGPTTEMPPEVSIDVAIKDGLIVIRRILDKILTATTYSSLPDRNTVGTLKDCMTMLMELRRREQELYESMSPEELEKIVKKAK